ERSPEPFDIDIVQSPAFAVHGYFHLTSFECLDEYRGCELGTLVRIEDFRFPVPFHGILHDVPAPFRAHRIGDSPAHDLAAVNIDDGKHIHESTEHGYVGNVRLPDLVGAVDLQVPEQVGKFIISLICLAEILFGIDGLQVHNLIQAPDTLLSNKIPQVFFQIPGHALNAIERTVQELPVNSLHHPLIE